MNADADFARREREQILTAVSLIEELLSKPELSRFEVISLGTLLQNVYTGVERLMRLDLQRRGWRVAKSETWHKDLLRSVFKEGLLTKPQFDAFSELLLFRHLHVHGYGHMLDAARVRELAVSVPRLIRTYLEGKEFEDGQPT